MNPQVTAAVISGSVALVVALVGIAGAVAAQTIATRRAFQNSLALFEREYRAQEEERREQARREDAFRFAGQRTGLYVRYARTARDLYFARQDVDDAAGKCREHFGQPSSSERPMPARMAADSQVMRSLDNARAKWLRLRLELDEIGHELLLLSSAEVREAAADLGRAACPLPDPAGLPEWDELAAYIRGEPPRPVSWAEYTSGLGAFFAAARRELGIQPSQPRVAGQ